MSCHGGEKCVAYKNNNTVKEVVKHEFLPPLHFNVMYFPTNMNTLMRISVHPLGSKYSLVDARMLGDVMHGLESELTFHCVCVVWTHVSKFHPSWTCWMCPDEIDHS